MNQRHLLMFEVYLQAETVCTFDNRPDCRFLNPASVQIYADVLADLELAFGLFWFAGHARFYSERRSASSHCNGS